MILSIETSTDVCSVALSEAGHTLFADERTTDVRHASALTPMIQALMKKASSRFQDLEAVAVSSGPGSYTGLRIGVSTAKGIAYAHRLPLIAVPTLSIIAHAIFAADPSATVACPMIDARRMEVYTSLISRDGQILLPTQAKIIDTTSFGTNLANSPISFGGNGASKCRSVITSPRAHFLDDIYPRAADMASLAFNRLQASLTESIAYFEPFYLKDFVATTPRNKVLNV